MLLTQLIPPRAEELKAALRVFNSFLEEPHSNLNERLEIIIVGGRGSGKSTIASGMILKATAETGAWGFSMRRSEKESAKWNLQQLLWSCETIGVRDNYSPSLSARQLRNKNSGACICFRGIDEGMFHLAMKARGIPKRRFLWIDEAEEIKSESEYEAILDALDLRENPIIILTANPNIRADHWFNSYVARIHKYNGENNRWVFKPWYFDLDRQMLGDSFFKRADEMRKADGKRFAHEYLGIPIE